MDRHADRLGKASPAGALEKAYPGVVLKQLGAVDVAAQDVHGPVPRHFHQLGGGSPGFGAAVQEARAGRAPRTPWAEASRSGVMLHHQRDITFRDLLGSFDGAACLGDVS